jgi:uncharacterized protein (TIGR02246 family)
LASPAERGLGAVSNAGEHDAIRLTLARYCQFVDDGRFAEFAELFTPDAAFEVLGRRHVGREAIATFMEKAQPPERRGKHVCANSVIDVDVVDGAAPATAQVLTDYVFVGHTPDGGYAITSAGRYHDRMVRDPDSGQWRFAERRIVFLGG